MTTPPTPLTYSRHKKIFSSLYRTEGSSSASLTATQASQAALKLFHVAAQVTELAKAPEFVVNIQGLNAHEIFFCSGSLLLDDDQPELVEVRLLSTYAGCKKRGQYLFSLALKVHRETIPLYDGLAEQHIQALLAQDHFELDTCRLNLEWIVAHYFSWLGFAPSIDDFFYATIRKDDSAYRLSTRFGGSQIAHPDESPIQATACWQALTEALRV